jgi:hypothetical protein
MCIFLSLCKFIYKSDFKNFIYTSNLNFSPGWTWETYTPLHPGLNPLSLPVSDPCSERARSLHCSILYIRPRILRKKQKKLLQFLSNTNLAFLFTIYKIMATELHTVY